MAFYPAIPASDGTSMTPPENAEFQVYELSDTTFASPLPLQSTAGLNAAPLVTTEQGVVPPVNVVSPNFSHIFKSGEWEWRRDSFDAAEAATRQSAEDAERSRIAAEAAASAAQAPADEAVDAALERADLPGAIKQAVAGKLELSEAEELFSGKPDNGGRPVGKGELVINVQDFGAVGDGVADDLPALQAAIAAAGTFGATVILEPGRTYKITSALRVTDTNVSLATWGDNAIIQAPAGQQFDIVTIGATLGTATKTLTSSMTLNTNGWTLNNTSGVAPGMLVAVKSSASWYYEPRPESTDTRKSELHRVTAVEGNTVWTEDPANDGYDVATETVELIFFRPIRVSMENITIRGVKPAYSATAPMKSGLTIRGAYEPRLINVNVEQANYLGISLVWCYDGKVLGGHTHSANAVPTGYGVQTDGCAHTSVIGRTFWECRRGVDFSGSNIISRHSLAENCINMGGGRQSDGQYYGWGPNYTVGIQNFGFGSHGAADHSTYRNNRTSNCQIPYSLRGGNEVVDGAYHSGRTRGGFIKLITGSGLVARNITLRTAQTGARKHTGIYDGGSNINARRPDYFLQIDSSYDAANARIYLNNIDAEVQDRFISMQAGALPVSFFHVGSCRVMFATAAAAAECAVLWHEGPLTAANFRWAIGPVDYRRDGGTGALTLTKNVNLSGTRVLEYNTSGPTA